MYVWLYVLATKYELPEKIRLGGKKNFFFQLYVVLLLNCTVCCIIECRVNCNDLKGRGIGSQCPIVDIIKMIKYEILREKLETPRPIGSDKKHL